MGFFWGEEGRGNGDGDGGGRGKCWVLQFIGMGDRDGDGGVWGFVLWGGCWGLLGWGWYGGGWRGMEGRRVQEWEIEKQEGWRSCFGLGEKVEYNGNKALFSKIW